MVETLAQRFLLPKSSADGFDSCKHGAELTADNSAIPVAAVSVAVMSLATESRTDAAVWLRETTGRLESGGSRTAAMSTQ